MKKLITILVGVVVATTMAFAQAAGPTGGGVQSSGGPLQGKAKGGNGGPIGQKIIKELGLDRQQMLQVKDLVVAFKQKREQIAPQGTKPNQKAIAPLRKQFMEDFAKILTPAQRDKFKTLLAERGKKRPAGKGVVGGAGAGTTGNKTGGGL